MRTLFRKTAGMVTLMFSLSPVALANTITFDGLGPANTWTNYGNWFGYGLDVSMTVGQQFTASVGGSFDEVFTSMTPDPNSDHAIFTLRLCADHNNAPGATIWERTFQTWPATSVFHLDNLDGPWLNPGQSYWLEADKPAGTIGIHYWWANDQGYRGTFGYSQNGEWRIWNDAEVRGLRVLVNTVPEPNSLIFILAGALLLLSRNRATPGSQQCHHKNLQLLYTAHQG